MPQPNAAAPEEEVINLDESQETEIQEGADDSQSVAPDEETLSEFAQKQIEAERKKYAGLDRKHSLLQRQFELLRQGGGSQSQSQEGSESGTGYQDSELAARLAEYQLKDGVREIIEQFGEDVPSAVKNAVLRNPRGFISLNAKDVSSALLEIEQYLSDVVETEQGSVQTQKTELKGKFVSPNANTQKTSKSTGKPDIGSMTEDELAEALDSGRLTDKDLENWMRTQQ